MALEVIGGARIWVALLVLAAGLLKVWDPRALVSQIRPLSIGSSSRPSAGTKMTLPTIGGRHDGG
jgi:hypothetical protein